MTQPIIQGIILGLLLTVFIGPVFFVLIETSLRKGIRTALIIDLGVFFSDITFIFLAYAFTSEIEGLESHEGIMQIIGGGMFAVFGLVSIFKRHTTAHGNQDRIELRSNGNVFLDIVKGYILNALNPSVLFYWLAMVSFAQEEFGDEQSQVVVFFISLLTTFFIFDILKIVGASYLKRFITPRLLLHLNKGVGLGLLILGGILVWKGMTV